MTLTSSEFEQAKSEALDMAAELVQFATENGWTVVRAPKANKKFAFTTLRREWGGEAQEELRAFYAIDPDSDDDQVTHVDDDGTQTVLDPEGGQVRGVVTRSRITNPSADEELTEYNEQDGTDDPVPPTSAAHTAAEAQSAAHQAEEDLSAAHTAAQETLDELDAELDVPPTGTTVVEHFGIVPPADEAEVARESLLHRDAAEKAAGKDQQAVWSQQDTYGAVRQQQVNPHRNWSGVASVLTTSEILTKLGVNRKTNNNVEVVWMNSLSGTLDRAVVSGGAEKYPPHITPADFDPDEYGEDLRILHFLELNGGFRSVAVARIRKIG
ncbi:hypothetical protein KNU02_gp86 [Gordonia phage Pleakley]|uniref:Uncharacterized protein n=1 Tax=Gordonia phage Pleakley TaxID=2283246 RepID=A0A345M6K4_9CAUD|nr:hypothetical protein KNU02_gp86 [Gordonia phage Pleakley]AXH49811.1 hypothetical protein SEA_FURY_86 [Gordonia phage Fury]AXH66125.1 hypothetical protein SEA_PLEAKLEY_86 [Gordonia phage Pleakley]